MLRDAIGGIQRIPIKRYFLRLHRILVPAESELGWSPYVWLVYLVFLVFHWLFEPPSPVELWSTLATLPVFFMLYFRGFRCSGDSGTYGYIASIVLLGVFLAPINHGAAVYFVYAAAFSPYVPSRRVGTGLVFAVAAVAVAESLVLGLGVGFIVIGGLVAIAVGLSNVYFAAMEERNAELRLSQDEVKSLAATAERERIARDLHDLLGHTLSTITLKSELARRLVESEPKAAGREMAEVENISRQALAQVRSAVSGYRKANLNAELAGGNLAMTAACVEFSYQPPPASITPELETRLAMTLREALTNVLRHSGASHCKVAFEALRDELRMVVEDDGRGGEFREGNGIAGMRQRLAEAGGQLTLDGANGTRLVASVPVRG